MKLWKRPPQKNSVSIKELLVIKQSFIFSNGSFLSINIKSQIIPDEYSLSLSLNFICNYVNFFWCVIFIGWFQSIVALLDEHIQHLTYKQVHLFYTKFLHNFFLCNPEHKKISGCGLWWNNTWNGCSTSSPNLILYLICMFRWLILTPV